MSDPGPAPSTPPLHALNPTSRFSDRARDYALYRPTYPSAAIDAVIRATDRPSSRSSSGVLTAADIGAGTGISARLLADRGLRVMAVEPNQSMRDAAQPHPGITWINGTAEHTSLGSSSVDLVLCAQAFHWFNAQTAIAEFHRILRPNATLCLMWNDRDNTDPLTAAYSDAINKASNNHPVARDRSDCGKVIHHTPLFTSARLEAFPSAQPLTLEGLIGRALSASYTPKSGPKHDALVATLTAAHRQHADAKGMITMRYTTRVYTAIRA